MGDLRPAAAAPVSLRNRKETVLQSACDLSVCSYNILASCHVYESTFKNCDRKFIRHEHRHPKLVAELKHLNADVFSLQEVEPHYFHGLLFPAMNRLGYSGAMQKKSNAKPDGVAIFWRESKCRLLCSYDVHLNELANKTCHAAGLDAGHCGLLRDTVALVVRLEVQSSRGVQEVYVTSVHVYWDWKLPDLQSLQIATLFTRLHELAPPPARHLICGDFNIQPTAPPYPIATTGAPDLQRDLAALLACPPVKTGCWETGSFVAAPLAARLPLVAFTQPLKVQSANKVALGGREAEHTTSTEDWQGCIDYIFYTKGLQATASLGPPPAADVKKFGGAPNEEFPSDHFPQRANFVFE